MSKPLEQLKGYKELCAYNSDKTVAHLAMKALEELQSVLRHAVHRQHPHEPLGCSGCEQVERFSA